MNICGNLHFWPALGASVVWQNGAGITVVPLLIIIILITRITLLLIILATIVRIILIMITQTQA